MSATNEAENASGKPNGENFNDEMKDYAKSTMNELLGMFGYEEEITREAVEELQIKLLPEADDENNAQRASETCDKPMETDKDTPVTINLNAGEAPVVVPIAGGENDGNPSVIPVPVTNNGVIPTSISSAAQPLSGVTVIPSGASETTKPGTALDQTATKELPEQEEDEGNSVPGVCVTYTSPPSKTPVQKVGLCKWCKKSKVLQNFSSSDGEKEISCKGLCSALCFEQAVKSIKESQIHIQETQQVHQSRPLPPSSSVGQKKPMPSSPITRSSTRGSAAAGKAKDGTVTPPKIPPVPGPHGLFSWDEYLVQTSSIAAPWTYFRQSSTPPYNGFQSNMKLEVADPRIVDTMCVATVVGVLGPRIRCRFDGTDSANDVWHLVDSREIHPVGWCEGNGGRLQPPVGFKLDPGKYSTFLARALANAEMAPVRLFKREPTAPKENLFKVGMKLEALDPKNPLLICVATVADVNEEKIRVDFDGYLGSDYWCRYDSRDIFPVGWCHYSGHPLQPPGNKKKALKILSAKAKDKTDKPEKPVKPDKPAKPEKPEKAEKQDKKKTLPTPPIQPSIPIVTIPLPTPTLIVTTPSSTRFPDSPSSSGTDTEDPGTNHTVQVFINHACEAGPYLSSAKVASLPSCFRGTVLNVARDCIQSIVNAGVDPEVVFKFLKPGNGKTKIIARSGKKTFSCNLQHIDRVSIFWRVLEKFSDNVQCCENLFCGERITGPCPKCGKSASRRNTVLPETSSTIARKSTLGSLKRSLHKTQDKQQNVAKHPRITIDDDDASQSPQVCSTSPPKTWSVQEVVKFIEKSELAEHAEMFRKHEIDGKALLLLTREMIMSYMGLKLGPAIKLLCFIDELKTKKGSS